MDQTLILGGIVCLVIAAAALIDYLVRQGGSIFDPISISWAGFILFFPIGMFSTAVFNANRLTGENVGRNVGICFLGLIAYTIGIYSGSGKRVAAKLPTPAPTLSSTQLFVMWVISVPIFYLLVFAGAVIPAGLRTVMQGLTMGFLGTLALVSLLGVLSRQNIFLKLIMVASSLGSAYIVLTTNWSRRPLLGMAAAAMAFFYRERIMRKSPTFRVAFLVVIFASSFVLAQYLTVTRGDRFYGAGTYGMFSSRGIQHMLGGIEINYRVFEFILDSFPENHEYLNGSGFVPGFLFWIPRSIWPSKPETTGWIVTCMWYRESNPENNLAPLFIGEVYANFGVLGVPFLLFIAGRFVRILNTYLVTRNHNQVVWLAWLMITPDFLSEWRGDFTSMTVQSLLRVIVFLGMAWIIGLIFKTSSPASSTGPYRLYSPTRYSH